MYHVNTFILPPFMISFALWFALRVVNKGGFQLFKNPQRRLGPQFPSLSTQSSGARGKGARSLQTILPLTLFRQFVYEHWWYWVARAMFCSVVAVCWCQPSMGQAVENRRRRRPLAWQGPQAFSFHQDLPVSFL